LYIALIKILRLQVSNRKRADIFVGFHTIGHGDDLRGLSINNTMLFMEQKVFRLQGILGFGEGYESYQKTYEERRLAQMR